MLTTAELIRAGNPYEQLINQLMLLESQPKFRLEDERFAVQSRKTVLSDLDSRLSALDTILDRMVDPISHPFDGRSVSTGETSSYSATASDSAAFGSHTIQVMRLASVDTRISDQQTAAASNIIGAVGAGAKSFTINVASPTEADPNNREDIAVSVTLSGSNDEEVLQEIADAINAAMASAYDAETIEREDQATASVVKETSDTARLSIRAGDTGYSNRISFTADPNGLLSSLGIDANSVVSGASGGQVLNVGTSEDTSDLTSQFVLDGLTIYRNSNQVNDALTGVNLTLQQTSTSSSEFSVGADAEGIEDEVRDFIDKYNDVLQYVRTRSRIDGETGARGVLAGDSAFSSLRFNLREDAITQVASQSNDAPSQITEIGMEVTSTGELRLTDADALIQAVEDDPEAVRTLFAAADGIATKMLARIDEFIKFDGVIRERQNNLDTRIRNLDTRIASLDTSLERREEQLRAEFARLEETLARFQGQANTFQSFGG